MAFRSLKAMYLLSKTCYNTRMCISVLENKKTIRQLDYRKALLFFLWFRAWVIVLLCISSLVPVVAKSDDNDQRYVTDQPGISQNSKLAYTKTVSELYEKTCNIHTVQLKQFEYASINANGSKFVESSAAYDRSAVMIRNKLQKKLLKKSPIKQIDFEVVKTSPHDKKAFTQGLVYYQDSLYESTGGLGYSELRRVNIKSGNIDKRKKISNQYFAEGITRVGSQLIQLTLKKNTAQIFDINNFNRLSQFEFKGEGWGVVEWNDELIISNGTDKLQIINALDYALIKEQKVTADGIALKGINEMEMVENLLFVNILPTNCIAIIDPEKYQVIAWLNLENLYPESERLNDFSVLNGIAYNKAEQLLLVTGKYWPQVYHLKLNDSIVGPLVK